MRRRLLSAGWAMILPALLLVTWWVWSADSENLYFPPLPEIVEAFWHTWAGPGFTEHILPSLRNFALGYVLGSLLAIACGVVIGLSRPLQWLLIPVIDYARGLPPPAALPFFILVLGIGTSMHVGVIVFGVFFVLLLNTIDGVREVEPLLRDMARVYRVPLLRRLLWVVLPGASPQIVAGLRIGLALGLVLMIVSEMVASTAGIGYFTVQAQQNFAYVDMWSGMLLLALLGLILNVGFGVVERRILHWQTGAAQAAGVGPRKGQQ